MCGLFVLFKYNATISQEHQADTTWVDKPSLHSASQPSIVTDLPLSTKRDSLFADRESQLDSLLPPSTMLKYSVKLLATAAFENTYSISIFAPAKYPKNSPTHHTQLQVTNWLDQILKSKWTQAYNEGK